MRFYFYAGQPDRGLSVRSRTRVPDKCNEPCVRKDAQGSPGLGVSRFPDRLWGQDADLPPARLVAAAHVEAPSPVSILLSGILLKMGAYGLLRIVVILPTAAQTLQSLLVFLALFGMIYGGLVAWRQSALKAMVAYS